VIDVVMALTGDSGGALGLGESMVGGLEAEARSSRAARQRT
jgi:hypothetical protein